MLTPVTPGGAGVGTAAQHLLHHGLLHGPAGAHLLHSCTPPQGIFSCVFHVCPSNISLQFDTTMMYVMLILVFVKVSNQNMKKKR